ncbi:Rpn family recombination-promoting nuclease/putative transposase [Aureispira anguillae]|uniref:Rpn family recombination-promoting nuclease/putative transposase n=1 Tax=Aureispira anguillae TaxID=2864201 RepID=A0A915YBD3_9BACT|nr:Rpn family recombination-promoting nuclease/putative transposase [Aureispira anguillae]BDS09949.1 Rpn family recombination-promoting nuclease/putative transposase [Aureispira anguillae]
MNLKDKYINPLTDFGFKKLFGIEPNKELLIDFLNQLLPSFHQIKNLSYTKNEHLGNTPLERKAIFDLYCESASGEKFIVEVQKAKQNFFKDRSVFYSTFPIQEQAKKGDWDFQLTAVYTIGILDFVFDEHKDRDDILHTVKLKDHKNRLFYDKLTYIYIELPKFTKEVAQLESKFDKWLYIFRHLANLQNRPIALQERIFQKLFEAAEIAKFSPKEKQLYEESLKYYRDLKNVVDTSKAEGIEEGIKKGIKKGRQDVAKEMKADGFSVSKIAQYTGLSEDEINCL